MRQRFSQWLSLLTVCFMLAVCCTPAQAALLDVGPTVPVVNNSTAPTIGHGLPAWYRDTSRMPLEPCLSQTIFPNGGAACILLADAGFNPALPIVFPTNFPSESFYFLADAAMAIPSGTVVYRAALEAAFPTGVVAPYAPITFTRVRLVADLPVAGTYKITHPYGVETVVASAAGKRALTFVRDIGVGTFAGAVAGDLGPWLVMQGFPKTFGTETFIGDYNGASLPVTGSPFGTNFVRLDGPVGSNLDGLGNSFIQTNLFIMMGKMTAANTATPLTVDRATYTRDAINTQVEVFATTQPVANVTVSATNLALAGTLSALQFGDVPAGLIPTTIMTTNTANDGKFFAASASFLNPATLPKNVTVTNTSDAPATSVTVPLVDEVVITEASYNPTTGLKVVAMSGDKLSLPALTVSMLDGTQVVTLGTIAGGSGQLLVTFPLTINFPATATTAAITKFYNIPPENVTVTSANLGSDTELVTSPLVQPPLAVNDATVVVPGGSVIIDVAANDTTPVVGRTVVRASVAIVNGPTKGTLVNNLNGSITYTQLPVSSGTDTFTYTILDNIGLVSNFATVTVSITNTPPVASPIAVTTLEDAFVIIPVAANAIDADTALNPLNAVAPATVLVTVKPLHGTATALGNGTVSYTPILNYNGPDSFAYNVSDTLGAVSNAAVVSITVTPVADAPQALNDFATTSLNTAVTINVLANDSHPDALQGSLIVPTTLAIVTNAPITAGVATLVAGQVLFTPTTGFSGTTSFTYTVSDNATTVLPSLPATVTVTVTPASTPPTANPDAASTFVNTPRIISVLLNDLPGTSPINPATVAFVGLPTNGTVIANLNGTVTFTPTVTVAGTGTFTYNVKDTAGAVSNDVLVTVSIAPSVIADAVTVLKAQYTVSKTTWLISGTTTNQVAPRTVTIYLGSALNPAQIIAPNVAVDAAGKWSFTSTNSSLIPVATSTISVALPSGASRLAFPVAVK